MLYIAIGIYAIAMTIANLTVAAFGPAVTPINAFLLIGLDLALRDWLHVRMKYWQMLLLIAVTGLITYALNTDAGIIAIASAVAFTAAAVFDWGVFATLKGSWLKRANASNVVGAAVDSLVFPTIAFGSLMWSIIGMQFIAKVAGGVVWSLLLSRIGQSTQQTDTATS
jgi:uncharacterized PurR-regulated membrane protein YhhQ (DUF165 family)